MAQGQTSVAMAPVITKPNACPRSEPARTRPCRCAMSTATSSTAAPVRLACTERPPPHVVGDRSLSEVSVRQASLRSIALTCTRARSCRRHPRCHPGCAIGGLRGPAGKQMRRTAATRWSSARTLDRPAPAVSVVRGVPGPAQAFACACATHVKAHKRTPKQQATHSAAWRARDVGLSTRRLSTPRTHAHSPLQLPLLSHHHPRLLLSCASPRSPRPRPVPSARGCTSWRQARARARPGASRRSRPRSLSGACWCSSRMPASCPRPRCGDSGVVDT